MTFMDAKEMGGWYQGGDRTCGPSATTFRFIRDDDGIVAFVEGSRDVAMKRAARIVECVNACTGIKDPAALVQAVRDAIDWIVDYVPDNVGGRDFTLANLLRTLGLANEESRDVTRQLLHWDGVPVHVTGTVTTSPGNWSLIDTALTEYHNE